MLFALLTPILMLIILMLVCGRIGFHDDETVNPTGDGRTATPRPHR